MRRRAAITSLHQMKEINVVPMIDIMMFLLVVFIITMPLIENGIPVNLPKGRANSIDQKHSRQITLRIDNQIYLDRAVVSRDQLVAAMRDLAANSPDTAVVVRADAGIDYGRVMDVLRILNDHQITKLALATSPEGPAAPRRR